MRRGLGAAACVLMASTALAQPALTIVWDQAGSTPIEAQGFIYRSYLDAQAGVILQGVTCALRGTVTECRAPLPIPAIGTHTVAIDAENEFGLSDKSAPLTFKYPAVPPAPTNLRIVKGEDD